MVYVIEMALPFLFFSPFRSQRVIAATSQVSHYLLYSTVV